jgi:uncharacterized protein
MAPTWLGTRLPGFHTLLLLALWQPLIEELLFRGVLQGALLKRRWARQRICGLTLANLLASLLFVLAHLFHQTPLWAGAVLLPSLIFGHFRDRHHHIYPSMVLHATYNAWFLLASLRSLAPTAG